MIVERNRAPARLALLIAACLIGATGTMAYVLVAATTTFAMM